MCVEEKCMFLQRLVVSIRTARVNTKKWHGLPTQCIDLFVWFLNKQRFCPSTTLTDWFL